MAVVTSIMAPVGLRWALARVPMDEEEQKRLEMEKLDAESFLAGIKRVLIPLRVPTTIPKDTEGFLAGSKRELLKGLPKGVAITLFTVARNEDRQRSVEFLTQTKSCLGGLDVQIKVVADDDPVRAILEEAKHGYGLIVIGSTVANSDALFNPAIDKLVRMAPCSVAVAAGGKQDADWRPSTILVPSNGSAASRSAAEAAFAIASASDDASRVIALHVAPPPDPTVMVPNDSMLNFGHDVVSGLREIGRARGVDVTPKVRVGDPVAQEILEEAESSNADLIVLGTDLRPGARRLHLGRGVETVLTQAKCSVLVINADD
jgi:nucleotide-binding universal stress UspA family protein